MFGNEMVKCMVKIDFLPIEFHHLFSFKSSQMGTVLHCITLVFAKTLNQTKRQLPLFGTEALK